MQILRADTEVKVRIGPFVDVGDGFTPQTDITLAGNEAELLKHNGAATVDISGSTWAAITSCRGRYDLTITAGNTDTEGLLTVVVQDDSDCLPVFAHFMVVNANVYDSLYGTAAADYLQIDAIQISGDATAADNCELDYDGTGYAGGTIVKQSDVTKIGGVAQSATDLKDFADTGYDPATHKVQGVVLADTVTTLTGHTAQTGDSYARIGAPAGASVSADIATIEAQTDDIGAAGAGLTDLGGMSTTMKGQVNTEAVDALGVDTLAELAQAAPTATPTIKTALMLLYMIARNKLTATSTELGVYNDAGTKIAKKTLADDGTTFTESEMASGA